MDYVDLKYTRILSSYLSEFHEVGPELMRCRCPLCGDSKKSKFKTRGYLFVREGRVFFRCHNCGRGKTLYGLMSFVAPSLCRAYVFERFSKDGGQVRTAVPLANQTALATLEVEDSLLNDLESIADLPDGHHAKEYLRGRQISEEQFADLYFTENVRDFSKNIEKYKERNIPEHPAVMIPFRDDVGTLMFIQCRFLSGEIRYMTLEIQGGEKIWGMDKVDWNKKVYMVEGPFDAMFVDNCIAAAGGSLNASLKYVMNKAKAGVVLIFDRDYTTNNDVFRNLRDAVESNVPVVLFDAKFKAKDINEAITLGQFSRSNITDYLESRTFVGLGARLEFGKIHPPRARNNGKEKDFRRK